MADSPQLDAALDPRADRSAVGPLAAVPASTTARVLDPAGSTALTPLQPAVGGVGRRRWPLLLIGASAGTATWSGWVGLGELTGFGVVHPLPGIWDHLTLNTAITLPVGVEAYAVYALAVATDARPLTPLARRWAWGSAAGALLLGMGGQIAYHLLAARDVTTAPAWVVALVSSLPVLVLGAASLLWHLAAAGPRTADEYGDDVPSPATGVAVSATAQPLTKTTRPASGAAVLPVVPGATSLPASTPSPLAITGPDTAPASGAVEYADPQPVGAARRPAAAERETTAPRRVTARLESPTDAEILAAVACGPDAEPPSIRALMRTYAIGQKRATRIHQQATKNQNHEPNQKAQTEQNENEEPTNHENQNPEISEEDDTTKITREARPETSNSPQQESQRTTSRNHTLASPTE